MCDISWFWKQTISKLYRGFVNDYMIYICMNIKLYSSSVLPLAPSIHLQIHPSSSHLHQASEEELANARAQPPVANGGGSGCPTNETVETMETPVETDVKVQPVEVQHPNVGTEDAVVKTKESKMFYPVRYLFFSIGWPNQLTSL